MDEEEEGNKIIELEFKAKESAAVREHELKMAKVTSRHWDTDNVFFLLFMVSMGVIAVTAVITVSMMRA